MNRSVRRGEHVYTLRWVVIAVTAAFITAGVLAVAPGTGATLPTMTPAAEAPPRARQSDTLVRLAGAPRHAGVATLVEDLTIGVESGQAEYMFSSIVRVFPLQDGTLLIIDRSQPQRGTGGRGSSFLRQYDAGGKFVRNFGRSGEGPGEFRDPDAIAQLPDGRVLVYDRASQRGGIHVYSASGQPLAAEPIEAGDLRMSPPMPDFLADRNGYVYRLTLSRRPASLGRRGGGAPSSREQTEIPLVYERLRIGNPSTDTIVAPSLPSPAYDPDLLNAVNAGGRGGVSWAMPYWPTGLWTWSPLGYMITAVPTRYAFELRIPPGGGAAQSTWKAGDRVVSIRRNVPPVPISDTERSQRRAAITRSLTSVRSDWVWRGPEIPRTKPAFSQLRAALDGRIWVRVAQQSVPLASPSPNAAVQFTDPEVFDVFEPDGTYIGQVKTEGTRLAAIRGDNVWSIASVNGVPMVKRFRISWP